MRAIAPLALLCATCRSSVLHVSPDGDDGSDGASPTSALRTVAAALHRLPAAEAGPAEIVLHGGVHGPARVAPKHTARRNERSRLTIRSAGGARRAIISGGVKVPASLFALHPTLPGVLVADLQSLLRACPFCKHLNCIEIPQWWSCCSMSTLQGTCLGIYPPPNASAPIYALCNMSDSPAPFQASCSPLDDDRCDYPPEMGPADPRLGELCRLICAGCG